MAYIDLQSQLPGVTGLLEYRRDTGLLLRELTQILLRGPSTLTEAERETIAMVVSHGNACVYCTTSHAAAADAYYEEHETTRLILNDITSAPVSEKMKSLLALALYVRESGKLVTQELVDHARSCGASDLEIHDTIMIAALFCFYNRYVDGLGTYAPDDPQYYTSMALRLKANGYFRPAAGYDALDDSRYQSPS